MKRLDHDFLKTAQQLVNFTGSGRPRQTDLRRAISTAYYAVFHALCHMCADAFIGTRAETRKAWQQVYRSLEHNNVRKSCRSGVIENRFPEDIKELCSIITQLQEKRHEADYDPFARFLMRDVMEIMAQAETALKLIRNLELKHRRAFAAWVILRKR